MPRITRLGYAVIILGCLLGVVSIAVFGNGTERQLAWCAQHDATDPFGSEFSDNLVLQEADKLGIDIPERVRQADAAYSSGSSATEYAAPSGWRDDLAAWRLTSDYLKACRATYAEYARSL